MTIITCAQSARTSLDRIYPHRDQKSDGILPSKEHLKTNPHSKHNTGQAVDLTTLIKGDGKTPDGDAIVSYLLWLIKHKMGIGKYLEVIIWNKHIWSKNYGWTKRWYGDWSDGVSPHTEHVHADFALAAVGYNLDWFKYWTAYHQGDPVAISDADADKIAAKVEARLKDEFADLTWLARKTREDNKTIKDNISREV